MLLPPPTITLEELEEQMQDTLSKQPEGFSIDEMSDIIGKSTAWCRQRMRRLIAQDRAYLNGKRRGTMIDGRNCLTPIYCLRKEVCNE